MSGYGSQPYGSSRYGIGTASQAPIPGGSVLRDPQTGASSGSRRIDPVTRDYVVDSSGRALGMNDVQQLVEIAIQTVKYSSAMNSLGQRLGDIDVIGDNIERQVRNVLEEAVAHLTSRNLVEIVSVVVTRLHPGAIRILFRWRDLTTGEEHPAEL